MINLLPSSEQAEIAETIGDFLRERLPVERLRGAGGASEHDPGMWRELAVMGCFGLSQTEEHGGVGLTLAEEVLAFREYGRFLVSPAILGTVIAATIAAQAGEADLLAGLIDGTRRAAIGNRTPAGIQLFDVRPDDLVVLWDEAGATLFEASSFGTADAKVCFDWTVTLHLALQAGSPVAGVKGDGIARLAAILIAATLTGITEGARDMAVEYARTRMQFGQPIGGFQAIKHKCADMGLGAEASWSQTAYAALSHGEDTPDAAFQAWNAKMSAGQAAIDAARANIQVHGGMGFTAEVNAHLYLKRAHMLNEIGGSLRALAHKVLTLPGAASAQTIDAPGGTRE